MKIAYFSAQDGSENDPKLAQDWSKMVMTAIFFHVAFCLQFWTVLGFVLAPCWDPFGLQDRSKIRQKILKTSDASTYLHRTARRAPKTPNSPLTYPLTPP